MDGKEDEVKDWMDHLNYLNLVVTEDIHEICRKEKTYKGSWKKRGGVGCFMMLARKWDRLENMMEENGYDLFAKIKEDGELNHDVGGDGMCLAEVRDLRRYLTLVEAQMMSQGAVIPFTKEQYKPGTPEDGGHHAVYEEERLQGDATIENHIRRAEDAHDWTEKMYGGRKP